MTSAKKPLAVFLGFGMVLFARGDEEKEHPRTFGEIAQAMLQQIGRIHADCKEAEVWKAEKLRKGYSIQRGTDGRELALDVKFLQAVIAAIDPAYNIDRPPRMTLQVLPPPETGFWSSVDPDEIEDPVIREKYRRDVEENNRRHAKYGCERKLAEMRKSLINDLQGGLNHIRYANPSRLPHVFALLDALDETAEGKRVKRVILAGAMYMRDGRGIDYANCDNPPTPPVREARKFITSLPPGQCQKVIAEIKSWYPEEERELLDTPLGPPKPSPVPVDTLRWFLADMTPKEREDFLKMVKEQSDYTEEELKLLDAL